MSSNPSLALRAPLLIAQLDGVAVALKDVTERIEAIRAAAQVAARETVRAEQPAAKQAPEGPRDDPDRIMSLAEAARLSSLSIDTLRRRHRDKWLRLSEGRYGMRRKDVLMLAKD
jgi:hypothetical protein